MQKLQMSKLLENFRNKIKSIVESCKKSGKNRMVARIILGLSVAGIALLIVLGSAGGGTPEVQTPTNNDFSPSSGSALTKDEADELNSKIRITTYFVNEDNTKLEGEIRYMQIEEAKKSTENIAGAIVTELLKGPSAGFKGKRLIPEGTKLLAPVTIAGSLAVVDLSSEFINNSSNDKKEIEMCIYSLVNSVTEIKELDRVKILIDGKEVEKLKETAMNMPFKRNKSLISVTQTEDAAAMLDDHDDVLLE